jgi:hypothetical protein
LGEWLAMTFPVDIACRSQRPHDSLCITCLDEMRGRDRVGHLSSLTKATTFSWKLGQLPAVAT